MDRGVREELQALVEQGYALHIPPAGVNASIWYPSWTLFLVLTLPNITVNWLPEQQNAVPELTPAQMSGDVEDLTESARCGENAT
jgi:hypothetical protein